jgi:hypothetical protein
MYKLKSFFFFLYLLPLSLVAQNYSQANFKIDYFPGSATLQSQTKEMLTALISNFRESDKVLKIEIIAHSDSRDLSEERILLISDFLHQQNIPDSLIDKVTEIDEVDEVEIIIDFGSEDNDISVESSGYAANSVKWKEPDSTVRQYCPGRSKSSQVFIIPPASDVNISGAEGTVVNISRNDLQHFNGDSVEGPIIIELKEFYSSEDIIRADLQTVSDDRVLETGGMLHLNVTSENKPLKLTEGAFAKIKLPAKDENALEGMDLFVGESMENGSVNWKMTLPGQFSPSDDDTYQPDSYVRARQKEVLDSVYYYNFTKDPGYPGYNIKVKLLSKSMGNDNNQRRDIKRFTHKEQYYDLRLPFINPPPVPGELIQRGGVFINIDRYFRIEIKFPKRNPPIPPSTNIYLKLDYSGDLLSKKNRVAERPTIALKLKNRSVFLQGEILYSDKDKTQFDYVFKRVPLHQDAVLLAFWDSGDDILFASQDFKVDKANNSKAMLLQKIDKNAFSDKMAELK